MLFVTEDVRRKFIAHDRTIGLHDVRLSEIDLRLQCTETANYEGVLIWKIAEYRQRKLQAVGGRILSLYSQPFYTSRYGYKMCARIYLNGDGVGRGTHLSLFFVVMQVSAVLCFIIAIMHKVLNVLLSPYGNFSLVFRLVRVYYCVKLKLKFHVLAHALCVSEKMYGTDHRHRSSVDFRGARHFCPKNVY